MIISNGRGENNPTETTLDGTLLAILENGSIRDHFNLDPVDNNTNTNYEFKLADQEFSETIKDLDKTRSISKTFDKPLGRGGAGELNSDIPFNVSNQIYNYNNNQLFASSDRITFNARKESMFLSAYKHIHIGCGSSMTFSTSKNILTEAAESVITNVPLFKVNSDSVYIDGRSKVIIGNPILDDTCHSAVLGDALVGQLSTMLWLMKEMCYVTSKAIENRGLPGGSLSTMKEIIESIDDSFGMKTLVDGSEYPQAMADLILSSKVELKK